MGRRDKRNAELLERKNEWKQSRTYTWTEVEMLLKEKEVEVMRKYNVRYTKCLASSLSAPPLKFGRKRVCDVVNLFLEQIEGLRSGIIPEELITNEAERLGIRARYENGYLVVDVDSGMNPSYKKEIVRIGGK